jgi:mono/diheme cytochrome c family protein
LAFAFACGLLIFTLSFVALESTWAPPRTDATPEQAFVERSIGTELAPVVVMEVMPDLFPDYLRPIPGHPGDWIAQYGFIRDPKDPKAPFPLGLYTSNYRPNTAAPSPVPFVGLGCAACHSYQMRFENGIEDAPIIGAGNPHLNIIAFSEAMRGIFTATDANGAYRLTLDAIENKHRERGRELTFFEKQMTRLWINAARSAEIENQHFIDDAWGPDRLMNPAFVRSGPGRTQPFRSLVRVVLTKPGASSTQTQSDHGFSKIPVVYLEDHRYHGEWAQFDGTAKDYNARSSLAAMTAGATVDSLAHKEIAHNIAAAASYTLNLRPKKWSDMNGLAASPLNGERVHAGKLIYQKHCYRCHGGPGEDNDHPWVHDGAAEFGTVIDVGTDRERLLYRHQEELVARLFSEFDNYPKPHPLRFGPDGVRKPPGLGYVSTAIAGAFTRAPYLHNASVLTLAELIHLKERRAKFYRGHNFFDPVLVGLKSPAKPDVDHYFEFDVSTRGNSNAGHDYPWPFEEAKQHESELWDLLEYLKTL